jgi:hypothetical protein
MSEAYRRGWADGLWEPQDVSYTNGGLGRWETLTISELQQTVLGGASTIIVVAC